MNMLALVVYPIAGLCFLFAAVVAVVEAETITDSAMLRFVAAMLCMVLLQFARTERRIQRWLFMQRIASNGNGTRTRGGAR